jgi:hypothetical protein
VWSEGEFDSVDLSWSDDRGVSGEPSSTSLPAEAIPARAISPGHSTIRVKRDNATGPNFFNSSLPPLGRSRAKAAAHTRARRCLEIVLACSAVGMLTQCRKQESRPSRQIPWSFDLIAEGSQGSSARVTAVAVDPLGNAILAGNFVGKIRIGHHEVRSELSMDGFVAKMDPGGGALWAIRTGIPVLSRRALAVDRGGNVFLAGAGAWAAIGAELQSPRFNLTKLRASDGALMWRLLDPDAALEVAAVSEHGDVCVAGLRPAARARPWLENTKNAHPDLRRALITATDIHLACFSGDGANRWTNTLVDRVFGEPKVTDLAFLSSGDVAIAGTFDQGLDLGATTLNHDARTPSGHEGFLAAYSPEGHFRWAKVLPGEQRRRLPPLLAKSRSGIAVLYSAFLGDKVLHENQAQDYRFATFDSDGNPGVAFSLDMDSSSWSYTSFSSSVPAKFLISMTNGPRSMLWEASENGPGGRSIPLTLVAPFSTSDAVATSDGGAVVSAVAPLNSSFTVYRSSVSRLVGQAPPGQAPPRLSP